MLFANDMILIDETHDDVNHRLKIWKQDLSLKTLV